MKVRHLAAWFSAMALLGTGAAFIHAQPPQTAREAPPRLDRARLRAEVVKLRTEVEMLRFDYDVTREALLEDLKTRGALQLAGGMIQLGASIQNAIVESKENPPGEAPRQPAQPDAKKAAEDAKAVAEAGKKDAAEEAAFIAERKKELTPRAAALAAKQMDLEDAERDYRAAFP
jgi:hypothetical protein